MKEPNVAIVVETHFELDIIAIKVDNQMVVIQLLVEDVLIDGRTSVNIITKNLKKKLGLPKPRPIPYHLKMVDQSMTRPLRIIRNLKIHIHGIPYIATFIVLKNSVIDSIYYMLLGRPWLRDAKVTHDWGNNVIIIQGNGTIRTISVNRKLGAKTRRPQIFVFYDLMEGLIDEEKDLIFEIELEMFSISTIALSKETVSLLNVGVLEIKRIEKFDPKHRTSDQIVVEVVPSTVKSKDLFVRPEVSLEDKVYLETCYHHSPDDIQANETTTKI
jgi:hypothetical protein